MKSTNMNRFRKILSGVLSAACVFSGTAMAGVTIANDSGVTASAAEERTGAKAFSWDNATVYFLLTDRFCNGDTSNDNAYDRMKTVAGDSRATFHGGDFAGITKKIKEGYFDDLGVNAIWMTAPYEQLHGYILGDGFAHYSYHGYYVTDYTEPDAAYGTKQEFQTLVDTAHEHGIRVIMDIVMNHAGYNNMIDMNEYNFGTLLDGWKGVYNSGDIANYHKKIDYTSSAEDWGRWWGTDWIRSGLPGYNEQGEGSSEQVQCLAGLPDFRTESSKQVGIPKFLKTKWEKEGTLSAKMSKYGSSNTVTGYISTWLAEWVETYGVDGFRCDTAKHVEFASWNKLKQAGVAALKKWRQNNPSKPGANWTENFWMTGECWDHGCYKDGYYTVGGFDSMINFETQGGGLLAAGKVADVYDGYAGKINSDPSFNVLSYISSHDTVLARGDQYYLGSAFLMLPGAVQIYYGDETCRPLVPGVAVSGDGHAVRSDMNWDSMDTQVLAHWQKVGTFRNNHVAVGAGQNVKLTASSGIAFGRTYEKNGVSDKIAAVINASGTVSIDVSAIWGDGTTLENFYDETTAVVSGGKVSFSAGAHGTILIQEPEGERGKVTVTHIDKDSNKTIKTEILSGLVGTSYSTTPLSQDGFKLASTTGKTSGTFAKTDASVTYYYTFDDVNYAYITTKYVDATTGESLADSETEVYKVGTTYSLSPKDIKNYEADTSLTTNATGTVKKGTTTVTFKYNYVEPSNLRVHYYNANSWSAVAIYAYDESTGTAKQFTGAWPGKTMTAEGDGWFYAEVPDVESATVIFNNNGGGAQEPSGVGTPGYDLSGEVWMKNGKALSGGKVNVKYVTTDGKTLASETISGLADGTTTYTTSAKTFDGYTLQTTPTNATGKFTEGTITVTYIYKADKVEEPLVNNSTVSATSITLGKTVTLTGKASGGTAPYYYALQYKKASSSSWSTIGTKYGTENSGSFKPGSAVNYDVRVTVKDKAGKTAAKSWTVKVSKDTALTNNSTISAESITLGKTVTLTGKASGGTSPYYYALQYKKSTASSWTTIGTKYSTTNTGSFKPKPGSAVNYDVRVTVKDKNGKTAAKSWTLKVNPASTTTTALTNSSKVSATSVKTGTTVTLTGAATGGTSPYKYAFYYKKSTSSTWNVAGTEFSTTKTATFTPKSAVAYDVMISVMDAKGVVETKTFAVRVTA